MLAFVMANLKLLAIASAVVVAAFFAGQWHGASVQRAESRAEVAEATIEQLRERGMINEKVKNLTDCELVRELGGVCNNSGE